MKLVALHFCQPKPEIPTGTLKESDITWEHSTRELVDITAEQYRQPVCR
uniref:Uncharacterized protein n=1 Tax=Escherichia coli TaxID=562 RepID=A0A5P1MTQ0_ECOLX|nr:hypothetical protein p13ZX36-90_00114 [Escherichia coli]